MLELRPSCENCNKLLPSSSNEARICYYECTFCAGCADHILHKVCPNCGGGFVPRPIRPSHHWKGGNFLGNDPATTKVTYKPIDPDAFAQFSAAIREIAPNRRQGRQKRHRTRQALSGGLNRAREHSARHRDLLAPTAP